MVGEETSPLENINLVILMVHKDLFIKNFIKNIFEMLMIHFNDSF